MIPGACTGRTSACVVIPVRRYRRWPGNEPMSLCDPCAERLRSMGLSFEEVLPEWVRRRNAGRLVPKDLTGALR